MNIKGSVELEQFLLNVADKTPKIVKKQFRVIGKKASKLAKALAQAEVKVGVNQKVKSKKYHNKFNGSRVWESDGAIKVSAYNSAPHAHLIEYGHLIKRNGKVVGEVKGKYIIKRAIAKYATTKYEQDLEEVLEKVLEQGGFR